LDPLVTTRTEQRNAMSKTIFGQSTITNGLNADIAYLENLIDECDMLNLARGREYKCTLGVKRHLNHGCAANKAPVFTNIQWHGYKQKRVCICYRLDYSTVRCAKSLSFIYKLVNRLFYFRERIKLTPSVYSLWSNVSLLTACREACIWVTSAICSPVPTNEQSVFN
jgi:hypothetical protein